MADSNFFSSLDYNTSSDNENLTDESRRTKDLQRANDWDRWSKSSKGKSPCPIYCKIEQTQHSQDWSKFNIITDSSTVFRNEQGDLFVRMDALLDKPFFPSPQEQDYATNNPNANRDLKSKQFTQPIKDFLKKYVLWKLSPEQQDKMSIVMIEHFHQGGICTVANRGVSGWMGGRPIQFPEAKQRILFEATNEGFDCSERNKYYSYVDSATGRPKDSARSFLSTRVDLSVKSDGIKVGKVIVSAKSELAEVFPVPQLEQGIFAKIWNAIRGLFGAKTTTETEKNSFISFLDKEQPSAESEINVNSCCLK